MNQTTRYILTPASTDASVSLVGGKARSLAQLAIAGLPVPDGFFISTQAYQAFVEANDLQPGIQAAFDIEAAGTADRISTRIRSQFDTAAIPPDLATAITRAYEALGGDEPATAVRSSATAEDLPEASFAGQQDSYLNIRGNAALLTAVRNCWASLWTARAIDYRNRAAIDHMAVQMGVVVQVMVPAQVSGILFTANPTTGNRNELIVNSSFGLGEAIVGGEVSPDTFVLDTATLQTKQRVIGSKESLVVMAADHGTRSESVPESKRSTSSLTDDHLRKLAALGLQVEKIFAGEPQDIEWAIADGDYWLLQSRPITNLPAPPLPDIWPLPPGAKKLVRRQVVENMPDPLSPLFADLYLRDCLDQGLDRFLSELGAPMVIEDFIERPFFLTSNGYAYCRADYRLSWKILGKIPKILYWYATSIGEIFRNIDPRWREGLSSYLETVAQWQAVDPAEAPDQQLISGVRLLAAADAHYWFDVAIVMGMAKITDGLLHEFLSSASKHKKLTSGMFLRGFPSQTLQAQEHLESIAQQIRSDAGLSALVLRTPPEDLLDTLSRHAECQSLSNSIQKYLELYGHQIYTLDFVQPTQQEDPLPVLLSLAALVNNAEYDTPARQAQMAEQRAVLEAETLAVFGPIRRWLFGKFLRWAQIYGPNREQALFHMGAGWPTLRRFALEVGQRLVAAGTLTSPEDVFFLTSEELDAACAARAEDRACPDLLEQTDNQKTLRNARMKLHPPGMIPPKTPWKIGPFDLSAWQTQKQNREDSDTLEGFAVSPGKVTGVVSLILSPADFQYMQPNTILVCPATTPAWTPLFSQASGLVTDIGGILAHGSIVAREYGIPAVMGTGNITRRVTSGQTLTVNGDTGLVTLGDTSPVAPRDTGPVTPGDTGTGG